jgi:hypothetical protein
MLNEFTVLLNIQVPPKHAENTLIGGRLDITVAIEGAIHRSQKRVAHPLVRFSEARLTVNVGQATLGATEIAFGGVHVRIHIVVCRDDKRVARERVATPEAGCTRGIGRLDRKLGHQILDYCLVKPPFLGLRLLQNVRVLKGSP